MFHSFDSWMLFFTAIGTLGLAVLAVLAYRKFLSQEALKTQMDIVIQLVKDLSTAKIPIKLKYPTSSGIPSFEWNYNLFEVAFGDAGDVFKENLHWEVILMKSELFELLIKPLAHLGNPLLPDSIAQKLWKLKRLGVRTPDKRDWSKMSYYVIGNFNTSEENLTSVVLVPNKMNEFKTVCLEIKKSITDWFEKYKVKDTNAVAFMNIDEV